MNLFLFLLCVVLAVAVAAELFLAVAINTLRKTCPWIITPRDLDPPIDRDGLARFIEHGWDAELGWCRKPGTSRSEQGQGGRVTSYHIGENGARVSPGLDHLPALAEAYGDSYTFCRQVNDDETWPHLLGQMLNGRIANRGVGNFGIDQALLRLEREFDRHPAPIVIMCVVPETICRVASYWKHFYEYGNVLAFKPRFRAREGILELLPNPMDRPEKFLAIPAMLPQLQQNDIFYAEKFAKDMLRFPYIVSLLRSRRRNLPLLWAAWRDRRQPGKSFAFRRVMERNIAIAASLYRRNDTLDAIVAVTRRYAQFVRSRDAVPVLVMLPQLYDLYRLRAGDHYYSPYIRALERELVVIDFGPDFAARNTEDAENYIDDRYGGHLSAHGNRIVAERFAKVLRDIKLKPGSPPAAAASAH
jgi:hypothetical protein